MGSFSRILVDKTTKQSIISGQGDPAGGQAAAGSLYLRSDGSPATSVYIKTGPSNTDWAPVSAGGAGSIAFVDITGKPTLVSSSAQISFTGISGVPVGIVSSSTQFSNMSITWSNIQTFTAEGYFTGGGQSLRLGAGGGDHTYLALYARTASPSTRTGWIGYGSAGTNDLSITNEANGPINFSTNGTLRAKLDSNGLTVNSNEIRGNNGNLFLRVGTTYNDVCDNTGTAMLTMGSSDPSTYYNNTTHYFRNRAASAFFATINSSGISVTANKYNGSSGNVLLDASDGSYTILYDLSGNKALFLGPTGDPKNYYDNTFHVWRGRGGTPTIATLDGSGMTAANFTLS